MKLRFSILMALVVVPGSVSEAGASGVAAYEEHNYTAKVGVHTIGFADFYSDMALRPVSNVYLGSFGTHEVPFSATQGLIGMCLIVVALIALLVVLAAQWRKRTAILSQSN